MRCAIRRKSTLTTFRKHSLSNVGTIAHSKSPECGDYLHWNRRKRIRAVSQIAERRGLYCAERHYSTEIQRRINHSPAFRTDAAFIAR